jgi:hypothetical protein
MEINSINGDFSLQAKVAAVQAENPAFVRRGDLRSPAMIAYFSGNKAF